MKRALVVTSFLMVAFITWAGIKPTKTTDTYTFYQNIRYGEKRAELKQDDPECDRILDVYIPTSAKPAKGYPTVMFIHGGGFVDGDKAANPVFVNLVKRGYAVVSINYYLVRKFDKSPAPKKLSPEGYALMNRYAPVMVHAVSVAADDAVLALKWMQKHAKEYGFNMKKLAISGGSAGAMTALKVAYDVKPKKPQIKAVIDLWGSLDDPNVIKAPAPAMIILHGDQDKLVGVDYARTFDKRMTEQGIKHRTVIMEGRGHAQYKYVSEHLMDEIDAFLKEVL